MFCFFVLGFLFLCQATSTHRAIGVVEWKGNDVVGDLQGEGRCNQSVGDPEHKEPQGQKLQKHTRDKY